MTVNNNVTIDGESVFLLPSSSKKKVNRICDLCFLEKEVTWNTIYRCRNKHKTDKDYCFSCSMKIYNTGENNSAKKPENAAKISAALKGKSKTFKDGKNYRILDRKINTAGYILKWSEYYKKHIHEHRLIYAESIGKDIMELNEIHHLDADKKNNVISNLIELTQSKHSELHSQIENLAFQLVRLNMIIYDRSQNKYVLNSNLQIESMEKSLGFEDIAIAQQKNICSSRLDVDTFSEIIRGVKIKVPMIASNMSTVINSDFYIKLIEHGAFGILHRAGDLDYLLSEIKKVSQKSEWVASSLGVESSQFDVAKQMIKNGANILTIDVAHGYSDAVLDLAKSIKKFSPSTKLIIGNTTNPGLLYESYEFVDAIKVGIAQGFACETKNTAGCTEKQFSAVLKFKTISRNFGIPIISDGGVKEPADFVKSIGAGANSIMCGKIFAACPESAAEVELINDVPKKIYAGMSSRFVQNQWKGGLKSGTCPEGGVRYLDIGESLENLIERYQGALRSGITYSGANSVISFQNNVKFLRV